MTAFKDSVFHRILAEDLPEVCADGPGIRRHFRRVADFIAPIPPRLGGFAYADGK